MWCAKHSKTVTGLSSEQIWAVLSDVNNWSKWQEDIEYARLVGEFESGKVILFKPQGAPELKIQLLEVKQTKSFLDVTCFPLAKMYDLHEIIVHGQSIEIRNTLTVEGPLSFIWRKLVIEKIAASIAEQTDKLIARVIALQSQSVNLV